MVVVENSSFIGEKTNFYSFYSKIDGLLLSGTKMGTNTLIPEEHVKVLNVVSFLTTLFIQDVPVLLHLSKKSA